MTLFPGVARTNFAALEGWSECLTGGAALLAAAGAASHPALAGGGMGLGLGLRLGLGLGLGLSYLLQQEVLEGPRSPQAKQPRISPAPFCIPSPK